VPYHDDRALPPRLSFVIAAHNSAAVIESTVDAVAKRLAHQPAEIIVAENGSTDGTQSILDRVRATWPADAPDLKIITAQRGLGHAVRAGIAHSTGDVIVITADDLPFGFDDLDAAEAMGLRSQMVFIGSKAHAASAIERSWKRTVLTAGLKFMRRSIIGVRTGDPQGTYVMNGPWARTLAPHTQEPGFLVTTEITYAAELSGVRPYEVPVRLRESAGRTRIRLSDISQMALGLFSLRRRRASLRSAGSAAGQAASSIGA
jgi:glycosyltransferase involved in cell wall biosynthesis